MSEYCPEGLIYEYCVYQGESVKCVNTSQASSKDHRERILAYCGWRGQDYFVSQAFSAETAIAEALQFWSNTKIVSKIVFGQSFLKCITYDRQALVNPCRQKLVDPLALAQLHAVLAPLKQQQRWRNDPLLLKQKLIDAWLVPFRKAIAEWLRNVADVLED
jgi:hypothetical protein